MRNNSHLKKMNRKAATVHNDIPIKLLVQFAEEIFQPLCNIINTMFEQGNYPELWKCEFSMPITKVKLPHDAIDLCPLSGVLNFAKATNRIILSYTYYRRYGTKQRFISVWK